MRPSTLYASQHLVCGMTTFGAPEARKMVAAHTRSTAGAGVTGGTSGPVDSDACLLLGPVGDPPDLREASESCGVSPAGKNAPFSRQHHALQYDRGDMVGATNLTCGDWWFGTVTETLRWVKCRAKTGKR